MASVLWQRLNCMVLQICLLSIIYATAEQPLHPKVEAFKSAVKAARATETCEPYTDPFPCKSTVMINSLSCDFNSPVNAVDVTAQNHLLPVCDSGEKNALWTNMPFYSYQFSQDDQDLHQGRVAVVSKCEMNTFPNKAIDPLQATATLRTGTYAGSKECERFHISFWCKFGRMPKVADKNDPTRFFLQLDMHRPGRNENTIDGTGLPSRNLWGSQISDYQGIGLDQWQKIVVSVTEFEQFTLMFFAHHNDGCDRTKLSLIHLDSVVVEKDQGDDCDLTSPPTKPSVPVTNSSPPITNPPTPATESAQTNSTTKPATVATCQHPWYTYDQATGDCLCPVSHMRITDDSTITCQEYPTIVKIILQMESLVFDESLKNSTSPLFKELAEKLSQWTKETFEPILGPSGINAGQFNAIVLSFKNGSIEADTLLRFENKTSQSIRTIRSAIINANSSLFQPITFNGRQGKATVLPVNLPFDACTENDQPLCFPPNTTECVFDKETEKSFCQCLPGSIRETPYSCRYDPSGVTSTLPTTLVSDTSTPSTETSTIYDPCSASPCGQNAKCLIKASALEGPQRMCACLDGYSRAENLPENANCQKNETFPLVLIIVISAVTGLVIILLIVIICMLVRQRLSRAGRSQIQHPDGAKTGSGVTTGKHVDRIPRYDRQPRSEHISMKIPPKPDHQDLDSEFADSDYSSPSENAFESNDRASNFHNRMESRLSTNSVNPRPNHFKRESRLDTFGSTSRPEHRPSRGRLVPRPDYPS